MQKLSLTDRINILNGKRNYYYNLAAALGKKQNKTKTNKPSHEIYFTPILAQNNAKKMQKCIESKQQQTSANQITRQLQPASKR